MPWRRRYKIDPPQSWRGQVQQNLNYHVASITVLPMATIKAKIAIAKKPYILCLGYLRNNIIITIIPLAAMSIEAISIPILREFVPRFCINSMVETIFIIQDKTGSIMAIILSQEGGLTA